MALSEEVISCITKGDLNSLKQMVDAKNINETDNVGRGIVDIALASNQSLAAEWLYNHSEFNKEATPFSLLVHAIIYKNLNIFKDALKNPIVKTYINNENTSDKNKTPLAYAINAADVIMVILLLENEANSAHPSVAIAVKNATSEIKTLVENFQKNSKENQGGYTNIIAEIVKKYDVEEAATWYLKSTEIGNNVALYNWANLQLKVKNPDLEKAVTFLKRSYPLWITQKDRNDVISNLKAISDFTIPHDEKNEKTEKEKKGKILADLTITELLLEHLQEESFKDLKIHLKKITSSLNQSNDFLPSIKNILSLIVKKYLNEKRPNVRKSLLELTDEFESFPSLQEEATLTFIDNCNPLDAKLLSKSTIERGLRLLLTKEISEKDKRLFIKLNKIRINASDDKKEILESFLDIYKHEKSIETLQEIIRLKFETKAADAEILLKELANIETNRIQTFSWALHTNSQDIVLNLFKFWNSVPIPFQIPASMSPQLKEICTHINTCASFIKAPDPSVKLIREAASSYNQLQIAYKNKGDKQEAYRFCEISAKLSDACGMYNFASLSLEKGDLSAALSWLMKSYPHWKNDKDISDIINGLDKITNVKINLNDAKDEKNTITNKTDLETIIKAHMAIININLEHFKEENLTKILDRLQKVNELLKQIPTANEELFAVTIAFLKELFIINLSPRIRNNILTILNQIKLDTASLQFSLHCHQLFEEKNPNLTACTNAVEKFNLIKSRAPDDVKNVIKVLKLRMKFLDRKEQLRDYKWVYDNEKDNSVLLEMAKISKDLKQQDDSNSHCNALVVDVEKTPLNEDKIALLKESENITSDANLKAKIKTILQKQGETKLKENIISLTQDVHAIDKLLVHFKENKNEADQRFVSENIDTWYKNISQQMLLKPIESISFNNLMEHELVEKNPLVKAISNKIHTHLLSSKENWYAKLHLVYYYRAKMEILAKDFTNQAALEEANQLLEKIILLQKELLLNTRKCKEHFQIMTNEREELRKVVINSLHIKNRTLAKYIIECESKEDFTKDKKTTQMYVKESYLPAIFHLAFHYQNKENKIGKKSRTNRALSLYVYGLAHIAGLSDPDAAKLFSIQPSKIIYWRDSAVTFIESIANSNGHKYRSFAKWCLSFFNLLESNGYNFFNGGLSPDAAILITINIWRKIRDVYKDVETPTIDEPEKIKSIFLTGLCKSVAGNPNIYSEKHITKGVAASQVFKFLTSDITSPLNKEVKDKEFDFKQVPAIKHPAFNPDLLPPPSQAIANPPAAVPNHKKEDEKIYPKLPAALSMAAEPGAASPPMIVEEAHPPASAPSQYAYHQTEGANANTVNTPKIVATPKVNSSHLMPSVTNNPMTMFSNTPSKSLCATPKNDEEILKELATLEVPKNKEIATDPEKKPETISLPKKKAPKAVVLL